MLSLGVVDDPSTMEKSGGGWKPLSTSGTKNQQNLWRILHLLHKADFKKLYRCLVDKNVLWQTPKKSFVGILYVYHDKTKIFIWVICVSQNTVRISSIMSLNNKVVMGNRGFFKYSHTEITYLTLKYELIIIIYCEYRHESWVLIIV